MIQQISVVIITHNASQTLANTLESLRGFSDVVVYNNGSTDDTALIAKRYPNVNLIEGEFIGFGNTKNKAASYAKNDWILNIDADEILDDKLRQSLETLTPERHTVYAVVRKNHYRSHALIRKELLCRLYNRQDTSFNANMVHESVIIQPNTTIITLEGLLLHYSFFQASLLLKKCTYYAKLYASQHRHRKSSSFSKAIAHGAFAFIRNMIIKLGIFDGKAGFIMNWTLANCTFYKYLFLAENNRDISLSILLENNTPSDPDYLEQLRNLLTHIPKHITFKNIVQICPHTPSTASNQMGFIETCTDYTQAKQLAKGDVLLVLRNQFLPRSQTLKDLDQEYLYGTCYRLNDDCFVAFKHELDEKFSTTHFKNFITLKS